jgi:arginine utilization protein RocB
MTDQMDNILKGIEKEIEEILYEYIKTESFTNTRNEKQAEEFFINYFSKIPYFKNTPDSYGLYKIENDALDRGYEHIENKFMNLGAKIKRVED